jgi:hypothetical protein
MFAFFSTGFTAEGEMIGPTLKIVPLNATNTVAIISYPAEQQVAVKASLAKVFNAGEETLKYELASSSFSASRISRCFPSTTIVGQ